jgi:hypothetical protein
MSALRRLSLLASRARWPTASRLERLQHLRTVADMVKLRPRHSVANSITAGAAGAYAAVAEHANLDASAFPSSDRWGFDHGAKGRIHRGPAICAAVPAVRSDMRC